jgi:hypothetical protein
VNGLRTLFAVVAAFGLAPAGVYLPLYPGHGPQAGVDTRAEDRGRHALHGLEGSTPKPAAHLLVRGQMSETEAAAGRTLAPPTGRRASSPANTLVITVRWGNVIPRATPTQARDFVFGTQARSTANWIRRASSGKLALQGTATGVLRVADPGACKNGSVAFLNLIAKRAEAAAVGAGFKLDSYPVRIINTPIPQICGSRGWGHAGRAWIGNGLHDQASLFERFLVAHELGHSFGLDHSHGLECGAVTVSEACLGVSQPSNVEYGDPFDAMGGSDRLNGVGMYNAQQLARIGWLPRAPQPVLTSGTYTISPLESANPAYAPALTITTTTRSYTIEFRQALGLDSFMKAVSPSVTAAVLVHLRNDLPSADSGSLLLDTTPGSIACPDGSGECDFYDAALTVGRTFTDLDEAFVLEVVSIESRGATVEVTFGGGNGGGTG